LQDLKTAERIAEVTYKLLLKEVLEFRPPYPTDLVQLEAPKEFEYPKPGDFGEVEYYRTIDFMNQEQGAGGKAGKKKKKGGQNSKRGAGNKK
jgi:hypothetical protein